MVKRAFLAICVLFTIFGHLNAISPNLDKIQVNCYECQNCSDIDTINDTRNCPKRDRHNFCVSYVEKWVDTGIGNVTVRGCGSIKGSCSEIKRKYGLFPEIEISECSECYEDKCNSALRPAPAYTSAMIPLFTIPIIIKSLL